MVSINYYLTRKLFFKILARLQGGVSQLEGGLEIYHEKGWRSVCIKHWTLKEAHVACRMMGYNSALYAYSKTVYRSSDSQLNITDLRCNGNEKDLLNAGATAGSFEIVKKRSMLLQSVQVSISIFQPLITFIFGQLLKFFWSF